MIYGTTATKMESVTIPITAFLDWVWSKARELSSQDGRSRTLGQFSQTSEVYARVRLVWLHSASTTTKLLSWKSHFWRSCITNEVNWKKIKTTVTVTLRQILPKIKETTKRTILSRSWAVPKLEMSLTCVYQSVRPWITASGTGSPLKSCSTSFAAALISTTLIATQKAAGLATYTCCVASRQQDKLWEQSKTSNRSWKCIDFLALWAKYSWRGSNAWWPITSASM